MSIAEPLALRCHESQKFTTLRREISRGAKLSRDCMHPRVCWDGLTYPNVACLGGMTVRFLSFPEVVKEQK